MTARRLAPIGLVLLVCAGCGRSKTQPTPVLLLSPGVYTITTATETAQCSETGAPSVRKLTLVSVPSQDGPDWVFRSSDQPQSTFELRLAASSEGSGAQQVNGIVRGSAVVSDAPSFTADFGKLGVLQGSALQNQASGVIHGQIRIADAQGNALTCILAAWAIVRTGN